LTDVLLHSIAIVQQWFSFSRLGDKHMINK
jgi:hypothetical protein